MAVADSIPIIDLRLLSHSDLQTLTVTSSSFNLDSLSDVSPTIDRSIFNESAATRKQTFSRLPLSPQNPNPNPNPRRRGRPRLHPNAQNPGPNPNAVEDVGRQENLKIVEILKKLFETCEKGGNFEWVDKEVRNGKGEVVDMVELGKKDDLFGEEIRRRTEGLRTEEQLLGYMTGLDGQWGSRRKKRKVVDASVFGDGALPKGWKVLLGLKRKDGIVYLNCRRYVSPSGKQFTSCKEVSSYIRSLNGQQDALQPVYGQHDNHASTMKLTTGSVTDIIHHDDNTKDMANCSFLSPSYDSAECDKRGQFFRVKRAAPENPLECRKSNLTFGDKDAHSVHLSTFHKSAKRRRHGKSLTDGVIMKDGKYECQFCHKTFIERRRYNGHIGAHIRYEGLGVDALPTSTSSTSSDPSLLAVVPHVPSDMNISVNESQEADTTNSANNKIHIDSPQCIADMKMKEIENYSNSGAPETIEAVTDSCEKETEHDPKVSATETTKGVSSGKSIDNMIEDCKRTCGDDKEIIKSRTVPDKTSHSGGVISPREIDVNNTSHACSPVITQEASTSKSVHDPINNFKMTGDKSGVIQDTNFQDVKSSMCLDDVSSLFTVNATTGNTSDENGITNGDISDNNMVGYKSENSADSGNATSTDIAGEIGHFSSEDEFVDTEINVCDISGYKSEVADTAVVMSIETNACDDALSPSLINVDNSTNGNSNGIDPASCTVISSTANCNGDQEVCEDHIYSLEAYESDFFTSKVDEPMGLDTSMHDKSDTASCHALTNGNTGIASTVHNELNATCIFPHIPNEPTSGIETNADCMFPGDVSKSLLEGIDRVRPMGLDTSMHDKSDTASCHALTDGNTGIASTVHNELNVTCIFPHIANEPTSGIETNADCMFPGDVSKSLLDGIDRVNYEFQDYFHSSNVCNEDATGVTVNNGDEGQSFQVNTADQSSSWMHSSDSIPFFDLITDQCQNELRGSDPRNAQANAAGFEELRLGSIEPSDFVLFTGQSSGSVTRSPMELFPDDQLEWGMSLTKMPTNSVSTFVCVWCGRDFILEGVETEPQSESLGYICPDCKARISGQFGILNNGYS